MSHRTRQQWLSTALPNRRIARRRISGPFHCRLRVEQLEPRLLLAAEPNYLSVAASHELDDLTQANVP